MIKLAALLAVVTMLSGCSLFESKVPSEQRYVLRPAAPVAAPATVPKGLQLLRAAVDPGLETERIALVRPGNRLDYYAAASWGGVLSDVFSSLAAQRFRASGAFATIDTDRGGFGAQYVLAITVRRFEAEYGVNADSPPVARVLLECTLGDRAGRATVSSFEISTTVPATENRLGAVVQALDRAANDALTQVIERSASAVAGK